MKKIFIVLLCLFMMTGCQTRKTNSDDENIDEKLYQQYQEYYAKLNECQDFDSEIDDCSISLILNKTNNDNIRYDIIIDKPQVKMLNIKAIAFVENEEQYNPPSIGLLEEETFSLEPGVIDKENGIYKGINLSGMTSLKEIKVKVYLTYEKDNQFIERFVMLHDYAS